MKRRLRIAVDQTVNIEQSRLKELNIITLPIHITNLSDELESALRKGDLATFYQLLECQHFKPQPATKAGSPYEIKEILEKIVTAEECDIICLVVGGHLSAIYDNTVFAAQEIMRQYPSRVAVIGEQAFLSLEILAEVISEMANAGKGFDEVMDFIEEHRQQAFVMGAVSDVRRLRGSGRVPIPKLLTALLHPFLKFIRVTPFFILESDRPRMISIVARSNIGRFIIKAIESRTGFREPLVIKISYTGSEIPPDVYLLRNVIINSNKFNIIKDIEIVPASPVIGVHAGAGLVAIGVMGLGYESISTEVLLRIFAQMQTELRGFRGMVNAINVFPVRDGDTGTNLLAPLTDATAGIAADLPVRDALNEIVMRIARRGGGYSGGALAAFFLGFNSQVREYETSPDLQLETFVAALERGTEQCYQYFGDDAKEGTILSVMRAAAKAARVAFTERSTFRNVLLNAYLAATDELLNPAVQDVDILRKLKLMDAGGLGFTLLLWSFLRTLGLHRESKVSERYQEVLQELRKHTQAGQGLIYRRQPESLRGFCVEGCVRGEVANELRAEFLKLDNRLSNPKMTFNVVDGTTHFHIHVSEGLEEQVLKIAGRYGFVLPPKRPTRLAKRRWEIIQFKLLNFFTILSRIPSSLVRFFGNWLLYAVFFPIMWERQQQRFKKLVREQGYYRLVLVALDFLSRRESWQIAVIDEDLVVVFLTGRNAGDRRFNLNQIFPNDVARELRLQLLGMSQHRQSLRRFEYRDYQFEVVLLTLPGRCGYLLRYRQQT